jgi:hypothetical protein
MKDRLQVTGIAPVYAITRIIRLITIYCSFEKFSNVSCAHIRVVFHTTEFAYLKIFSSIKVEEFHLHYFFYFLTLDM